MLTSMKPYQRRLYSEDGVEVFVKGWIYEDEAGHSIEVPDILLKMWRPGPRESIETSEHRLSYRPDEVGAAEAVKRLS